MSREELNRLKYTIALIAEFAARYGLDEQEAYNYLHRFTGLHYLKTFYDVLHTLSFDDAIETMTAVCSRNGGELKTA